MDSESARVMQDILDLMKKPETALLCGPAWREGAGAVLLRSPRRVLEVWEPAGVPEALEAAEGELQQGRWVAGYVAYEAGAAWGLPTHAPGELVPLLWMGVYEEREVLALEQAPARAEVALGQVEVGLNVSREEYHRALERLKEYLAAGDTYQVNYTCRARFEAEVDPAGYFLTLVGSHPVPYAAYLNLGGAQVISLSPELFLQRRGDVLESRPMKGTRGRGRSAEEDEALRRELVSSEKDRAENLMIVDMVRNDLGRLAVTGSVQVPALFTPERYRTVWQMTSMVTCRLQPGTSLGDIFGATFPGASITGAPKRRTMEIIRELEAEPRGVYTGALGLFAPGGDFTCNLPIRTLVHREGRFELGIGAGIVWDSETESEYEETLLKAQFAFNGGPELRLWETLLLTAGGEWAYGEEHLGRLARSAEYWGFPYPEEQMRRRLAECAAQAGERPRVVRLELDQTGGVRLTPRAAPAAPERPVRVLLSGRRTNSADRFLYHKTSRRELYDREREAATGQGFFEVIFANEGERLTEGAISNLFLRREGVWVTPRREEGLLPGLWREEQLGARGAQEAAVPVEELGAAEAVVVGNSVRGAIEVDEVRDEAGTVLFSREAARAVSPRG